MTMQNFVPYETVVVSSSGSSANVALPSGQGGADLMLQNTGTVKGYYAFGTSSGVTAAAANGTASANTPIMPGDVHVITPPTGATYIAFYAASASTLEVTAGSGR